MITSGVENQMPCNVRVNNQIWGKDQKRKYLGVMVDILPGKPGGLLVVPEKLPYVKLPNHKSAFAERSSSVSTGEDLRRRPTCH